MNRNISYCGFEMQHVSNVVFLNRDIIEMSCFRTAIFSNYAILLKKIDLVLIRHLIIFWVLITEFILTFYDFLLFGIWTHPPHFPPA